MNDAIHQAATWRRLSINSKQSVGFCLTQAFIFDFDGTLVDSEQAIYQCFQSITKQLAPE
jgi:hypothetical protein